MFFSLHQPGIQLPSPSMVAPSSGAEVSPGEALGTVVNILEQ